MILNAIKATTLWVVAVSAFAQVEVIDRVYPGSSSRSPQILPRQTAPTTTPADDNNVADNTASEVSSAENNQLSEMYFQVQMLLQEIQQLRGTVEELDHQVKQLKQQRLDDYLDLDRRIGLVTASGVSSNNVSRNVSQAPVAVDRSLELAEPTVSLEDNASSELSSYREAMDLILKEKQFDRGTEALLAFLDSYPASRYAGNAQYWLGEVYLKNNDLGAAQEWFTRLLEMFPTHGKVIDAKFKLGTVLFLTGHKEQSRRLLDEVATSNTSTAGLAENYIRENF